MRYSRTGIIIALVGAEIFIAGAILAALGGHHAWASASEVHGTAFSPRAVEPIDAGPAPKIEIDDSASTVTVGVSSDGRVHVSDNTSYGGAAFSSRAPAQLSVERTPDGVRISRADSGNTWIALFGWFDRRISVDVPQGSSVDITACSGADVSGLSGLLRVRSDDGEISARDLTGDVALHTSDGNINLTNVRAKNLTLSTDDGHLHLSDVAVDSIDASTNDGSINGDRLQLTNGNLHTQDGSIELAFAQSNVLIHAHTDDGSVSFDGRKSNSDDDDSTADFHIGAGGGALQVATNDGDIHILTNGAQ